MGIGELNLYSLNLLDRAGGFLHTPESWTPLGGRKLGNDEK